MAPEDSDAREGEENLTDQLGDSLNELERGLNRLKEGRAEMKEIATEAIENHDRLLRLHQEISGALKFGGVSTWFLGAQLSWAVAAAASDDLPARPSYAAAGGAAVFAVLALLRARQERWERNLQTLQDNILILLVTVLMGVVFLVLGS